MCIRDRIKTCKREKKIWFDYSCMPYRSYITVHLFFPKRVHHNVNSMVDKSCLPSCARRGAGGARIEKKNLVNDNEKHDHLKCYRDFNIFQGCWYFTFAYECLTEELAMAPRRAAGVKTVTSTHNMSSLPHKLDFLGLVLLLLLMAAICSRMLHSSWWQVWLIYL